MNCNRCNVELPDGATFCHQCGNPIGVKPIFPAIPQEQQPTGHSLSIGCLCVLGIALMIAIFLGAALFNMHLGGQRHSGTVPPPAFSGPSEIIQNGKELHLHGKTLDDEDFDWESLRGKYVLVQFTATWCPQCHLQIPGMLEAYEKYHDKGLEIVSVYILEDEPNAVATVKKFTEKEKIPWTILSESLTVKAGQPPQGDLFGIWGVPAMYLVDKEGKVISPTEAEGGHLNRELKKLFAE
jgi:thiol-disulfide isomerase/thioredoxin